MASAFLRALLAACVVFVLVSARTSDAAEALVAVDADFADPAREIALAFAERTDHTVALDVATASYLAMQLAQGVPYEVLVAAGMALPDLAVKDGRAVAESRFTYAIGRIALWSATPGLSLDAAFLSKGAFTKIAIADPKTAPYGAAAVEAMRSMKVYEKLKPKIVEAVDSNAVHRMVASGEADLGFVAWPHVVGDTSGSVWVVPDTYYAPIRREAILLKAGANNPAAKAFLVFLKGPQAEEIIRAFGYATK